MSHSISVTTSTTTSSSTAIKLNKDILRTPSGMLKLSETIIGAVCLGIVSAYGTYRNGFCSTSQFTFFFLVTFAFLVTTSMLLLSFMISLSSANMLPKTVFELLYHLIASIFYLAASLAMLAHSAYFEGHSYYDGMMAASVFGLVNTVLYFISTFFSFRSYRSS